MVHRLCGIQTIKENLGLAFPWWKFESCIIKIQYIKGLWDSLSLAKKMRSVDSFMKNLRLWDPWNSTNILRDPGLSKGHSSAQIYYQRKLVLQ